MIIDTQKKNNPQSHLYFITSKNPETTINTPQKIIEKIM